MEPTNPGYYFTVRTPLEHYIQEAKSYLKRRRTVLVSRTSSIHGGYIVFTFVDDLLKLFVRNLDRIKKPYESAMKYGYRGYSRGGQNGIFCQRVQDKRLQAQTHLALNKHLPEILQDLEIPVEDALALVKVKIVYHDPSGERVVGVMDNRTRRIIFLGFARY